MLLPASRAAKLDVAPTKAYLYRQIKRGVDCGFFVYENGKCYIDIDSEEWKDYIKLRNDESIGRQDILFFKENKRRPKSKEEKKKREYIDRPGRIPNLRLRYAVLKRDNFKCKLCGASPATNPTVELQVDHIIPWSKGGKTTIDNLQTLCSWCNLGKFDSEL